MQLTQKERDMAEGRRGPVLEFAMGLIVKAGVMLGAERLVPIESAYINTTFAMTEPNTDLLRWIAQNGVKVVVPTYTNVGIFDVDNPNLRTGDFGIWAKERSIELYELHKLTGCRMTLTCAPYQLPNQPGLGAQISASESNAVSYFNSVAGARTLKYGDFIDMATALIGKVPFAGLHTDEGRKATLVLEIDDLPDALRRDDLSFQLIGHAMGRKTGSELPALVGVNQSATKENLRSISATGASAGGVAMYHAVGLTPEAPTLEAALATGNIRRDSITFEDLLKAKAELTSFRDGPVNAVAIGTPHSPLREVGDIVALLDGRKLAPNISFFVQMNRFTLEQAREKGWIDALRSAGVTPVSDTCLYWRPFVDGLKGRVMTNSGKFAYYGPGEMNIDASISSLKECVESAVRGAVWRDPALGFGQ